MKVEAAAKYWLFVVLAIMALLLVVSAFLLWVVFPQGYFPSRLLWVGIHKWAGFTLSILVIFHVMLHWNWLLQMTRRYFSRTHKVRDQAV